MKRGLTTGALALVMLLLVALGSGAAGARTTTAARPHATRVLVLSLPTVEWSDLERVAHAEPAPALGGRRAGLARDERRAVAEPAG